MSPAGDERFPGTHRLSTSKEFDNVFKKGKKFEGKHFRIYCEKNSQGLARLGIVVSKKRQGNAVKRNRIKRLIREVFRQNKALFNSQDTVVIALNESHTLDYKSTQKEIRQSLLKLV